MLFVKTDDLKVGMRLAKPVYNKQGVLLYERESTLSAQAVSSIQNFGLIGLYILEPAEPAPPISEEEIEFERFQTIYMFRLKEVLETIEQGEITIHIGEQINYAARLYTLLQQRIDSGVHLG